MKTRFSSYPAFLTLSLAKMMRQVVQTHRGIVRNAGYLCLLPIFALSALFGEGSNAFLDNNILPQEDLLEWQMPDIPEAMECDMPNDFYNPFKDKHTRNQWIDDLLNRKPEEEFSLDFDLELQPSDHWINPITDLCWSCFYPLHIVGPKGGSSLWHAGEEDIVDFETKERPYLCSCLDDKLWEGKNFFDKIKNVIPNVFKKAKVGIPLAFWEPMFFIEVTSKPYKFLFLKGKCLGSMRSSKHHGGISQSTDAGRTSFYHVHSICLPLFRLSSLIPGFEGMDKLDPLKPCPIYLSEWDPTWRNPDLARVFSMEMYIYNKPIFQEACRKSCEDANKRRPNDHLFWCAGCRGSFYPFTGHVAHHIGGVQSSSLLVERVLARHHFVRSLFNLGTGFEEDDYCKQKIFAHMKKSHYKTQLVYPIAKKEGAQIDGKRVHCHPLGESTSSWESHCTSPGKEDFAYVVWTKMHLCFNVLGVIKALIPQIKAGEAIAEAVEVANQ